MLEHFVSRESGLEVLFEELEGDKWDIISLLDI